MKSATGFCQLALLTGLGFGAVFGAMNVQTSDKMGMYAVTVTSMMIPTNGGFIAVNGAKGPRKKQGAKVVMSPDRIVQAMSTSMQAYMASAI